MDLVIAPGKVSIASHDNSIDYTHLTRGGRVNQNPSKGDMT